MKINNNNYVFNAHFVDILHISLLVDVHGVIKNGDCMRDLFISSLLIY